ncbi:MAG: acyl carrier protein phosphodiesterase, partial [Verrucomicrobiota bacterium]
KYRLPAPLRRFAGIVVDVYYDHLLSIHWQRYMDTSREVFIDSCHAALLGSPALPDPQWRPFLERLVEENWLGSYASLKGIGITLDRISQRSPRVAPIAGSVVELEKNFASYEEDFLAFYPEVLGFVNADS